MQFSKLNYADSQYPPLLKESGAGPNPLYVRGAIRSDSPMVAVVGTRRPSPYGKEVTINLVTELAASGIGIVSGLALGVDAIAHTATLDASGYTIAVLGNGIDKIYPPSNQTLADRILSNGGAIVSEHQPGMPGLKQNFPARNRIIAGLAHAVLVTEADANSGTRHSVHFALQFSRTIMAVPGNITSPLSAGPNEFIYNGGYPITNASQVIALLKENHGVSVGEKHQQTLPIGASELENTIIGLIAGGINQSQRIIEASGLSASAFAQIISLLEITGKVRNQGGGLWSLARRAVPATQSDAPQKSPGAVQRKAAHTERMREGH